MAECCGRCAEDANRCLAAVHDDLAAVEVDLQYGDIPSIAERIEMIREAISSHLAESGVHGSEAN